MALNRISSRGLGHIALDDANANPTTSSNVGNDGRVNVQFHASPKMLAGWVSRFQGNFCDRPPPRHPPKVRKGSYIPFDDDDESHCPRLPLCIAIHIVGSRGDVQPFIPIAQLLKSTYGHRVRICTHPVFKDFVESNGVEFFSIGGDPEALMAYMVKNPGLLPSRESMRAGDISKRRAEMSEIINGGWRSCIEAGNGMSKQPLRAANVPDPKDLFIADAIIANPPSMAHIHCAEKLGIPLHMVFTMPWSPTEAFHHPLAAMNYGESDAKSANYLSFMVMELLTWQGLGDIINKFRMQTLHLDPISPMWGCNLLPRHRVPFTYLWTESLIPKPDDWDSHIKITGFSFLPMASKYTPPDDLVAFLQDGPAPIYIGFGSIVVDDPQALTRLIFEAVRQAGVRAIVSKGWGGVGAGDVPPNVYLIGNCPHDWLFQRVSAVVHHGGAGTTAAGIAAGRPTVVVPFFGDQPFWGKMIARAGAGPTPVPFKAMTAETLAASITFALQPECRSPPKVSQAQMEAFAHRMATKTLRKDDNVMTTDPRALTSHEKRKASWAAREEGKYGRAFYVTRATGRYVANLTKIGLKAPVAMMYNIANGCHNYPSYGNFGVPVRPRDPITGFGTGLKAAGKGFYLSVWDAFSGVVVLPYRGAKDGGAIGTLKGIYQGGRGFTYNLASGYSMKGIEKEYSRHHLTKLKAEIFLIRIRQGIEEFRESTQEERDGAVAQWKRLRAL
ncbi:CHIP6 [Verticillium alfalfae VaMs.102]|uniref:CHIP6 n=1 Tax=Verticillium alfalfae (strain VaMs.102 / ATCC MYA-4576 / FGSC 10136) TaxID=526221 RepID=C9SFY9_VERA1|nr:CHIP6 [Verticillium alfalfae VaMs.102]EEY17393.1 CHIP6 [Verticillium alfalfae VaMs.102]